MILRQYQALPDLQVTSRHGGNGISSATRGWRAFRIAAYRARGGTTEFVWETTEALQTGLAVNRFENKTTQSVAC